MMPLRRKIQVLVFSALFASVAGGVVLELGSHAAPQPLALTSEKTTRNGQNDADEDKKPILSKFMRQKLVHTNDIMEGLLTEDPKMIKKAAEGLKKMSEAEEWRVSNDVMYRNHSEDFRRTVDKLIVASKGRSIDRAALASFDVTLSCIDCHRYVRTVLIAHGE